MVRVMSSLGATLGSRSRSDRPRNLLICATKRHSVGLHLSDLPMNNTGRSPDFNQTLDILVIVRSHMLHGGPRDFLKDEVTAMNIPEALGLVVEQQIFVVASNTCIITSFAHKIASEELSKCIVVVVHP
jgi:hypothetical protein